MSRAKELSIVTLTYNRSKLLLETLRSLQTTAPNYTEILVFDDASTDDTEEVVRAFSQQEQRIHYYRQPKNKGFAGNAADGLAAATGEYVCTMPDDDLSCPGNFEAKLKILREHPEVGFVYSLASSIDVDGVDHGTIWRDEYCPYSYIGRDEFRELITGNYIPGPSVVFRRSLMEEHGGMDMDLATTLSDWDLWLRYSYHMKTAFIAKPLVKVRAHPGNMSGESQAAMALGMIPVWRKWLTGPDAPLIGERTWQWMYAMYMSEVGRAVGLGKVTAEAQFNLMRNAYLRDRPGLLVGVA